MKPTTKRDIILGTITFLMGFVLVFGLMGLAAR